MAYSTAAEVRALVDTDLTDLEIGDVIDECDDILDLQLNMGGLSANIRRALSRTYSVIRIMLKDPTSESLGEWRGDRTYTLEKLNEEFERMIKICSGGFSFTYDYAEAPRDPSG